MKELQKKGILVREGTNRSGRWMVKGYGQSTKEYHLEIIFFIMAS